MGWKLNKKIQLEWIPTDQYLNKVLQNGIWVK